MLRKMASRAVLVPVVAFLLHDTSFAATVVVNDVSDVLHDSGGCSETGTGTCTLRDAITFANSSAGADSITFAIDGSGLQTITLTSSLPAISNPVAIDGYSQAGAAPNTAGPGFGTNAVLLVEINAAAAGNDADTGALTVTTGGGGTTIRGLVINHYPVNGIALVNSGGGNTVEGNYIGVNAAGDAAATSGTSASGIEVRSFDGGTETGDTIGGASPDARNVIAGNNGSGQVTLTGPSVGHRVSNNFIGTNAAGNASLSIAGCASSSQSGIVAGAGTNGLTIGDETTAGRNVISGNCAGGIRTVGPPMPPPLPNRIIGNFIGTDAAGNVALGNQGQGIALNGVGITFVTGNVISGSLNTNNNAEGILVENAAATVTIQDNKIGTDVSGTRNLGNQGAGVLISNSSNVVVGGIGVIPGPSGVRAANVIAFNGCCQLGGQPGVSVLSGTGNSIRGNSIFANASLPIDLGGDGVTLNDDCDTDGGANGLQNAPVLTSVFSYGFNTTVYGSLQSKASTTYQIDFYVSNSCEPSSYIGTMPLTTSSSACGGNIAANFLMPFGEGERVTATATDPAGNTSEVSLCATAIPKSLTVDPTAGAASDGNGVLEPGETVTVEPSWENPRSPTLPVTGTASDLTGPDGASHTTVDAAADYGSIPAFGTQSCHATANCYSMFVSSPAVRPSPHWDASFTETLGLPDPTKTSKRPLPGDSFDLTTTTETWRLHVGDSFTDVPRSQPFYKKIETIFHNGIAFGCSTTAYCPAEKVTRAQMAIFISREIAGGGANVPVSGNVPGGKAYNCVSGGESAFTDVSPTDIFCKSVHYLASTNVTSGCGPGLYCPGDLVSRSQMAIFMAKGIVAPQGGGGVPQTYGPDPRTGLSYSCDPSSPSLFFSDVSTADPFCKHVHFLWAKGIIGGCSSNQYCPPLDVGRDEMAKFLANGFRLQLYGP